MTPTNQPTGPENEGRTYTLDAIETAFFNHRENDGSDGPEDAPAHIQRKTEWQAFKRTLNQDQSTDEQPAMPDNITPPKGYEILTPEWLRKYGCAKNMQWITTAAALEGLGDWEPTGPDFEITGRRLGTFTFAAPIGTMAPANPLPVTGWPEFGFDQWDKAEGRKKLSSEADMWPQGREWRKSAWIAARTYANMLTPAPDPKEGETPRVDVIFRDLLSAFVQWKKGAIYPEDVSAILSLKKDEAKHLERELTAMRVKLEETEQKYDMERAAMQMAGQTVEAICKIAGVSAELDPPCTVEAIREAVQKLQQERDELRRCFESTLGDTEKSHTCDGVGCEVCEILGSAETGAEEQPTPTQQQEGAK